MKINTKIVLILSSIFLGMLGVLMSFFPQEIANHFKIDQSSSIFFQLTGALYVGFAMVNWMVKGSTMGGIYNRPIAIGNFTHFVVGGLALLKYSSNNQDSVELLILTGLYAVFAVTFGLIVFTHPLKEA